MIHEWVGLRFAWLINSDDAGYDRQWLESYVFVAYGLAWIIIVLVFQRQIRQTAWLIFAFTFMSFGVSVGFDLIEFIEFLPSPETQSQKVKVAIIEDLAKLGGSFFALAYAVHVSRDAVRNKFAVAQGM